MMRRLCVLMSVMLAGSAGLMLPAAFGGSGAQAQMKSTAPLGHRQPRAGDVPSDSAQKEATKSPEDIALERALGNICRGCSPIIAVRDVPRYDIARTCPAGAGDTCRTDEERARQTLQEQWGTFPAKARSDCVQTNEIGGRPSYVQLGICLKTAQIAPTVPEGR